MALRCELCGRWRAGDAPCECGYRPGVDLDGALVVARRHRAEALDKIARGLVATIVGGIGVLTCGLLAIVLLWIHTLFATIPVLATFALAALGSAGIGNVIGGTRDHVRAGRVVRAVEQKRALPEARVIS